MYKIIASFTYSKYQFSKVSKLLNEFNSLYMLNEKNADFDLALAKELRKLEKRKNRKAYTLHLIKDKNNYFLTDFKNTAL